MPLDLTFEKRNQMAAPMERSLRRITALRMGRRVGVSAWIVLLHLWRRGGLGEHPSLLAAEAKISTAAVTGIVNQLVRRGLVTRTAVEEDRRRLVVCLTPAGEAVVGEVLRGE